MRQKNVCAERGYKKNEVSTKLAERFYIPLGGY